MITITPNIQKSLKRYKNRTIPTYYEIILFIRFLFYFLTHIQSLTVDEYYYKFNCNLFAFISLKAKSQK